MFTFKSLPLPPSANEIHDATHRTVWRKDKAGKAYQVKAYGKTNSKPYKSFLEHCELIGRQLKVTNPGCFNEIHDAISKQYVLDVTFYFCIHHNRVFTQKGLPQSFDTDNRLKPMLDGFKRLIDIDDKYAFRIQIEKIATPLNEKEQTIAILKLTKPRTFKDISSSPI